jgi:hypothetical protein
LQHSASTNYTNACPHTIARIAKNNNNNNNNAQVLEKFLPIAKLT